MSTTEHGVILQVCAHSLAFEDALRIAPPQPKDSSP